MRKLGTLEFGPVKVAVKARAEVIPAGDADECWGAWYSDRNIIELREGMSRGRFMAILLHEMTHAIQSIMMQSVSVGGVPLVLFEQEATADAVGLGVAQNFDRIGRLWRAYRAKK